VDGERGGTWIGVNDQGVAACVVNRYPEPAPAPGRISRGLLLASLLDVRTCREALRRIEAANLDRYAPCHIACFEPGAPVLIVTLDGRGADLATWARPGLVLVSSATDQAAAEAARRVLFDTVAGGRGLDAEALDRLHGSHLPDRGPLSVCMHREDAETVSSTRIVVRGDAAELRYTPGPPCLGQPAVSGRLPLRRHDGAATGRGADNRLSATG